ncbi:MAG: DUF3455 domain-containing protein [Gammaproteobacteria bacterium]
MKNRIIAILIASLGLQIGAISGAVAGSVPQVLQPPAGSVLKLQTQARGDQIYQCTLHAGEYRWQLQAPDAVLLDAQERQIGRHFGGPTWEFHDGSRVTGRLLQKVDATAARAIPWLLVEVVKHEGSGMFADVRYINRVDTQGGLPPAMPCDANHIGQEKRAPYRASYYFYTAVTS